MANILMSTKSELQTHHVYDLRPDEHLIDRVSFVESLMQSYAKPSSHSLSLVPSWLQVLHGDQPPSTKWRPMLMIEREQVR